MLPYLPALIVGRFIHGITSGISSWVVPMFIKEISPMRYRGPLIALTQQMITTGLMIWLIMGLTLPNIPNSGKDPWNVNIPEYSWRLVFAIPGIVALIQLLLILFIFKNENPKYCKVTKKNQELGNNLTNLSETNNHVSLNSCEKSEDSMVILTSDDKVIYTHNESLYELLSFPRNRALLVGCCVHIFQQFSGINMVFQYSFYFSVVQSVDRLNLRFFMGILNATMTLGSMYLVKVCRRRPILMFGFLSACACNSFIFILFGVSDGHQGTRLSSLPNYITISVIWIYIMVFSLTIGALTWVYSAEILTDRGMGLAISAHWISNMIIFFLPNFSIDFKRSLSGESYKADTAVFFFLFSGLWMVAFFFMVVFARETHKKTRKAISYMFGRNVQK